MLFETLSQPKIFAILALTGFISGLVFDISNYVLWLCKKNKVVQVISDFFATLICFLIFYITVVLIDYGNARLYHILTFLLTFTVQRFTLGKIIAKLLDWCYNFSTKFLQKLLKGLKKKSKHEKHSAKSTNKIV